MAKFLLADLFPGFVTDLAQFGEVHGPVLTDQNVIAFGPVDSPHDLLLRYQRTLLPPKKYLLPPQQKTFSWNPTIGYHCAMENNLKTIVLLGLHMCDLAGIAYLDNVFLSDQPDPHYKVNRSRLILIGSSCEADSYCFCSSLNSTGVEYDMFVETAGTDFIISAGSPLGAAILDSIPSGTEYHESPSPRFPATPEEKMIVDAVSRGETFPDSPLWEDFARRCLSCGACSVCCPTCYCFDAHEMAEFGSERSHHLREWDNCLFRSHGEIAGGYNFRPSRIERFHYRYQHKYLGFGPTRGIISCVGCGRCREVCPVKIDLLALFEQ